MEMEVKEVEKQHRRRCCGHQRMHSTILLLLTSSRRCSGCNKSSHLPLHHLPCRSSTLHKSPSSHNVSSKTTSRNSSTSSSRTPPLNFLCPIRFLLLSRPSSPLQFLPSSRSSASTTTLTSSTTRRLLLPLKIHRSRTP